MSTARPKARICRRYGTNIYGSDRYDRVLQKKPYPPGKSPRSRRGRKSPFAEQFLEKQKMRDMYVLSERQFRRLYEEAARLKGRTGDSLKQLLERRLDNVLYRAGFAVTRLQARQFATHGLFAVNGRRITIPSYRVRQGERITARERSRTSPVFGQIVAAHGKYMPPGWLKVDVKSLTIEVAADPGPDDAEHATDVQQIVEFYSRT